MKQNEKHWFAPVSGRLRPITEAPDFIFSKKVMGDGFFIEACEEEIYAPCSGTITTIFPTKHALCITDAQGFETWLYLGIGTVELKGKPFENFTHLGAQIQAGDLLCHMDLSYIRLHHKTPVVLVNFPTWTSLPFSLKEEKVIACQQLI